MYAFYLHSIILGDSKKARPKETRNTKQCSNEIVCQIKMATFMKYFSYNYLIIILVSFYNNWDWSKENECWMFPSVAFLLNHPVVSFSRAFLNHPIIVREQFHKWRHFYFTNYYFIWILFGFPSFPWLCFFNHPVDEYICCLRYVLYLMINIYCAHNSKLIRL